MHHPSVSRCNWYPAPCVTSSLPAPLKSILVTGATLAAALLASLASAQGQGGGPLAGLGIGGLPIPNLGQLFGGGGGQGGPLGGLGGLGIPGNQRGAGAQPQGIQQLASPLLSRLRGGTSLLPRLSLTH